MPSMLEDTVSHYRDKHRRKKNRQAYSDIDKMMTEHQCPPAPSQETRMLDSNKRFPAISTETADLVAKEVLGHTATIMTSTTNNLEALDKVMERAPNEQTALKDLIHHITVREEVIRNAAGHLKHLAERLRDGYLRIQYGNLINAGDQF